LQGIVDGLAMVLCIIARGASANEDTYWEGTRHIFDINLDHVNDMYQDHQNH